ncbi:hypothetical protein E2C01_051961 [Portunus trituberculatus]|uniref:Uncharacterized protein n=1 Tax=Portunus trituberculatus TaxID=210409 RepID=A0A5B7GK71_PORTR|nr:hypothetical protein [Portunus trituberculatus]
MQAHTTDITTKKEKPSEPKLWLLKNTTSITRAGIVPAKVSRRDSCERSIALVVNAKKINLHHHSNPVLEASQS